MSGLQDLSAAEVDDTFNVVILLLDRLKVNLSKLFYLASQLNVFSLKIVYLLQERVYSFIVLLIQLLIELDLNLQLIDHGKVLLELRSKRVNL